MKQTIKLSIPFFNKKKSQIKVLIFGQGRTGSTLLEDLLQSTGYFESQGEILNSRVFETEDLELIMDETSEKSYPKGTVCHVKIYQLTRNALTHINVGEYLKLMQTKGWTIIYIHRKNKLNQAISVFLAQYRNMYHTQQSNVPDSKITLNLTEFIGHMNQLFIWQKNELNALSGIDYIEINYEDNLQYDSMHQKTIDSLLIRLGLSKKVINTRHQKINKQAMSTLILNYTEFCNELDKHGWLHFIED